MTAPPIPCQWDGEAFRPARNFGRTCDKHFVVGAVYRMVEHEDRSQASHNHFFAEVTTTWENLPEHLAGQYPSPEHLRKAVLIRAGWCDMRQTTCNSRAEALRLAAFARTMDEYALVSVNETVVSVFVARSQSFGRMKKAKFQAVKDKVLAILADMLGTTPSTLSANAGQAA